jgi:8-amino-7-oxononanoate synthase
MNDIEIELEKLHQSGLKRNLSVPTGIDFSSNDYLGLARSNSVQKRLINFLKQDNPLGSTGSRLISGESELVRKTEQFLAETFDTESALIFGSGYLANIGVMGALSSGVETDFFSDEYNHASLIDGMRLANGKINIFAHNDFNHLEKMLSNSSAQRKIVVTESVFSMDGDSPDLIALLNLCVKFCALLVVDEAHATGVCGINGLGLLKDLLHKSEAIIVIHTCGKALGSYGAFVSCSKIIRELLINKARSFIYSTALPPILIAHIRFALEESIHAHKLREQLNKNIQIISSAFQCHGLSWSGSHIGYIQLPGNERVVKVAAYLETRGYHVRPIRFPSVTKGQERLRITIKSFHTESDIKNLTQIIVDHLI